MNFLAHLFLSRENEELMIGNFIADSVKGHAFDQYSLGIKNGILLHRKIDAFTDAHPVFLNSVVRLRMRHRKYAGVITDIIYDHFLASCWNEFAADSLDEFTEKIQTQLIENKDLMPQRSQRFLDYMLRENIPVSYATLEGIEKVLYGMSRRAKFENSMHVAGQDLAKDYRLFEEDFRKFFPSIIQFTEKEKRGR